MEIEETCEQKIASLTGSGYDEEEILVAFYVRRPRLKFFESENGNEKNVWKLTKFPIKDLTFFRIEAGPGKAQNPDQKLLQKAEV